MKLTIELDGKNLDAEFVSLDGSVQLTADGRTYHAQVNEPEPGCYVVVIDHRVYRCALERSATGATEAIVDGRRISAIVQDKKRIRSAAAAGAGAGGRATLIAPMPGKIVRLLLQPGDEVAAHQGVLIVEAMKMQNEVQSTKTGRVLEIRVAEGQTVNAGDILAVIE